MTVSYPSLLWITIPPFLVLSAYLANKLYKKYRLKKYGIGRGAQGFQTNVKQLRVTPAIAERLRRGEHVSAEEIAEAVAHAELEAKERPPQGVIEVGFGPRQDIAHAKEEPTNEWLPEHITNPKKRGKPKSKRR